jgi:hypothetical protein
MIKYRIAFIIVLLFFLSMQLTFSQSVEDNEVVISDSVPAIVYVQAIEEPEIQPEPKNASEPVSIYGDITDRVFFTLGYIWLSNRTVTTYNILLSHATGEAGWATPQADYIHRNLFEPWNWRWEVTDGFQVNEIGHPFQGSIYHNAARINGFNYYQSLLFTWLGSYHWETVGEGQHTAWNDLLAGFVGGPTLGEMFFRLYASAYHAGVPAPVAALFNPAAGLHQLLTKWKPPNYDIPFYEFQILLSGGYAQNQHSASKENRDPFYFLGPFGDVGFNIVYGNPFEQDSRRPYDHFELNFLFGMDGNNYSDLRLFSHGYLFSFNPVNTDKNKMSTGLTLHSDMASLGRFDFYDSSINYSNSSLSWTIKHQHLFSEISNFQTKFHTGFTFMGVSNYVATEPVESKYMLKNFGTGINSKVSIIYDHGKFGRLALDAIGQVLWSYPGTSAIDRGTVFWLFTDATYLYRFKNNMRTGITYSFSLEKGIFKPFDNTYGHNNVLKLLVGWGL